MLRRGGARLHDQDLERLEVCQRLLSHPGWRFPDIPQTSLPSHGRGQPGHRIRPPRSAVGGVYQQPGDLFSRHLLAQRLRAAAQPRLHQHGARRGQMVSALEPARPACRDPGSAGRLRHAGADPSLGAQMNPAFGYDHYLLKRQVLALTGKFRVYAPDGSLALFSQQKMFRLREDIRVYADEARTVELLWIQARQILDFSAAYDVTDSTTSLKVGSLRRRGFQSLVRDAWDSLALGLLRRLLLGSLLPQNYDALMGGTRVADLRQRFHLFRYEMDVDFRFDTASRLDRRLGLAAAILLAAIEGKQAS